MKKNKKYAISFLITIILISIFIFVFFSYFDLISINGRKFITQTVRTNEERKKGLGEREELCQGCAMLFIFEKEANHLFWMKDMKFDLDIIWIKGDEIVHIEKNIPYDFSNIINPKTKADKVLEFNAGISDKFDFRVGDKIDF